MEREKMGGSLSVQPSRPRSRKHKLAIEAAPAEPREGDEGEEAAEKDQDGQEATPKKRRKSRAPADKDAEEPASVSGFMSSRQILNLKKY